MIDSLLANLIAIEPVFSELGLERGEYCRYVASPANVDNESVLQQTLSKLGTSVADCL